MPLSAGLLLSLQVILLERRLYPTEHTAFDQGLARRLAEHMDARCLSLRKLHADALYEAVKQEMRLK